MEENELKSLTINQLRRLSTQLGVSGAGKKVELIDRILLHSSSSQQLQDQDQDQAPQEVEDHVVEPATGTVTEKENRISEDVNVVSITNDDRWSMSAASSHATTDLRWIFNQMQSRLRAVTSPDDLAFLRRTFGYPDVVVLPQHSTTRQSSTDSNGNNGIRKRNDRNNPSSSSGVRGKKVVKKNSKRMPSIPESNQNTAATTNPVTEILMYPESDVDVGYEDHEGRTSQNNSVSGMTGMMNRLTIVSPTSIPPSSYETTMLPTTATIWPPPPIPSSSSSSSSTWRDTDSDRYGQYTNTGGGGMGLLTSLSGKKPIHHTAKPKTAIKPPAPSTTNMIKAGSQTTVKQPKKQGEYSSLQDEYHHPHNPLVASGVGGFGRVDESRVNHNHNHNHNNNHYQQHNHHDYGSSSGDTGISTGALIIGGVNVGSGVAHTTGKKRRPMGVTIPTLSMQQQQQPQQQPPPQSHPISSANNVHLGVPAACSSNHIDSSSTGQHAALSPRRVAVNPFSNLVVSTKTTTNNNNNNNNHSGKSTLPHPPLPQPSSSIPSSPLSSSTSSSTSTSLQQPWLSQSTNYPTTTHPPKPTAVALSVSAAVSEAAAATVRAQAAAASAVRGVMLGKSARATAAFYHTTPKPSIQPSLGSTPQVPPPVPSSYELQSSSYHPHPHPHPPPPVASSSSMSAHMAGAGAGIGIGMGSSMTGHVGNQHQQHHHHQQQYQLQHQPQQHQQQTSSKVSPKRPATNPFQQLI